MRKFYWYLTAYAKKHGLLFFLSLFVAITIFSLALPTIISSLEYRKRHYIGIVGNYSLTNLPPLVANQLSAGLTKVEENGDVLPLLAERWTVEQEGTTYRFLLKPDLYWQDGEPLTPSSIQYQLQDVESISTPNDLVFKLPAAYAPFPTIVSQPVFRLSTKKKFHFFEEPTIIGIGAYKISSYEQQSNRLTELIIDGNSNRFIYRLYLTEDDAVMAFKRGEVDTLINLSKAHDIMDWQSINKRTTLNYDRYLAIFFNNRDPRFQKNIRQAFSYATSLADPDKRAVGPINPKSWAYLEGSKVYEKDLDRATERLLDDIPPSPLSLELTTTSLFAKDAERIKKEWEEFSKLSYEACQNSSKIENKELCENVQIRVTIRITSLPDTSNFQLLLIGQESPAEPDQYHLWHSEQASNFSGYKNTRIDNLLEKGRQTYDQNERLEIYQEFQQFFLDDSPAIFIRHLESYDISRSKDFPL